LYKNWSTPVFFVRGSNKKPFFRERVFQCSYARKYLRLFDEQSKVNRIAFYLLWNVEIKKDEKRLIKEEKEKHKR